MESGGGEQVGGEEGMKYSELEERIFGIVILNF
jgi:hypothetical protein